MNSARQGRDGSNSDRAQFKAFYTDELSRDVIERTVKDLVIPHATLQKGGVKAAIKHLGENRSPKILLVDLSVSELPLSDINELAEVCEPGVAVIALGDRNDVGLFRELINRGVSDYLVKPLTPSLLQKSLLSTMDSEQRTRQTNRLGRLVAVTGTRGGVGATMLTTSIAYQVANTRRRRVAVVDLDLKFGSVSLYLDLEPSRGFKEALESASRVDSNYLDRSMTKHSDTLFVLSVEEDLNTEINVDKKALDALIHELRMKFHYVIVDLPRDQINQDLTLLEDASNVFMVTDLTLAGMRDTVRIGQCLPSINASCNINIVANKIGACKEGEINKNEFEKGIGKKIDVFLPYDPKNIVSSTNIGQPASASKNLLTPYFDELTEVLCGGVSTKPNLLRRLLGKG